MGPLFQGRPLPQLLSTDAAVLGHVFCVWSVQDWQVSWYRVHVYLHSVDLQFSSCCKPHVKGSAVQATERGVQQQHAQREPGSMRGPCQVSNSNSVFYSHEPTVLCCAGCRARSSFEADQMCERRVLSSHFRMVCRVDMCVW